MKKYLMTGIAAVAMGAAMTSCSTMRDSAVFTERNHSGKAC